MVLVDTSVWIRALASRGDYKTELDRLLDLNLAAGHELVYGELLIGDRGGRQRLLADYKLMRHARRAPHDEVVALVQYRGLHGRGASWIDIHLLASALAERMTLWTADEHLAVLSKELGVAYRPR